MVFPLTPQKVKLFAEGSTETKFRYFPSRDEHHEAAMNLTSENIRSASLVVGGAWFGS